MTGRSAAIQIVKPSTNLTTSTTSTTTHLQPARELPPAFVPSNQLQQSAGDGGGLETPGKKDGGNKKLCRNVMIYGSCRFQDSGCVYYHPQPGEGTSSTSTDVSPKPSVATPLSKDQKSGLGAAAPVFVPKTPLAEVSPTPERPVVQPLWPNLPEGGLMPESSTAMQHTLSYDDSSQALGVDHSMGIDSSMYMSHHQQPASRPLDHHLYTSPLPHITNPPLNHHPLHSFFIPDDLRRFIQDRHDATYLPGGSSPGLPTELGVYHSLTILNDDPSPGNLGAPTNTPMSKVYGHPAPVYRAVSNVDGNVYALRRIEGYKLVNEAAFGSIESWRRMKHPNIVGLREAFTTKAFNDNSLILVYDFFPNSTTVWAEHLSPEAQQPLFHPGQQPPNQRRKAGMPIPEKILWSYITQIANALKAMHSSNLAARNLDPSKVLITGKNRIRLNGCGVLDVLAYDGTTPVAMYQQEDLVSFGKLVISMCCEFFQPGQHPAGPLEHIARTYSPDVKNLVMFLISKPSPMKSVDDVIRMLGVRILNELDAMQNYTDVLECELGGEIENGRIVRLLTKLGFINERAEFELDPRWSDTGDRYILKLFRDYVFHSVGVDGKPVLDLSHVMTCLNKLDAGLDERIMLVSRDDQSCLVVSYKEIKTCVEAAYGELRNAGGTIPMRMAR